MRRWDIFCKIVDNFGDIGVCWRLARQLVTEHNINVRLWIDDLHIAKQLIPALDTSQTTQLIDNITISVWNTDVPFEQAADAVIEAFGCELPAEYIALMRQENIWVNLEYLSAEPWVEGFHAHNSKRGGLTRHFFFPGFTNATGGLLREHGIVEMNRKIAASRELQAHFFQQLNLATGETGSTLKVSLFSYPHAPIRDLLAAMADSSEKTVCYVPATSILPKVAEFFGEASIRAGDHLSRGNLTLHVLSFLSQLDYDKLLASCDINFVRGEDSWIRAIWAGKPFIWQPYLQSEDTHIAKLQAFLDLYYSDCEEAAKQAAVAMHNVWSSQRLSAQAWQNYLSNIDTLNTFATLETSTLATQTDLATNLVIYIEKSHDNHI